MHVQFDNIHVYTIHSIVDSLQYDRVWPWNLKRTRSVIGKCDQIPFLLFPSLSLSCSHSIASILAEAVFGMFNMNELKIVDIPLSPIIIFPSLRCFSYSSFFPVGSIRWHFFFCNCSHMRKFNLMCQKKKRIAWRHVTFYTEKKIKKVAKLWQP